MMGGNERGSVSPNAPRRAILCALSPRLGPRAHFLNSESSLTMIIGVPKEIKTNENRIALVPAGAEALVQPGHPVLVEQGGGLGSGFEDAQYSSVGAELLPVDEVWGRAEVIVKVKAPMPGE